MRKSILFTVLVFGAMLLQAQSITVHQTCGQNGQVTEVQAVDLGLSVKWANMNVGAESPEDYGNYYAWGETVTKATYGSSTYFGPNHGNYNFDGGKTILDPEDDAAHVNWGGSWRMPTKAEWQELIDNCTWTWTTQNGINGYKVTSNKAGYTDKFIFLPAAGYRDESVLNDVGSRGGYWSSSLGENIIKAFVYYLLFYSDSHKLSGNYPGDEFRSDGRSVRPVLQASSISSSSSANDTIRIYSNGCDDYQTFIGSHGSQLTMTANSDQWSHFVRWQDGNTDNPRTITTNGNADYTAYFETPNFSVQVQSDDAAKGRGYISKVVKEETIEYNESVGTFEAGSEVEISATANYGYHFVKWNEMNSIPDNSITVADAIKAALELAENTPSSNQYIVVGYIVGKYGSYYNSYYIADTPDGESTFVIYKADNSASIGEKVMISGYLLNYYGTPEIMQGGKVQPVNHSASTANPYTLTVTEDKTYIANFAKNVYSITANAEHGSISGNSTAEYLDYVTLTVTPDYGYHFTQWLDGLKDNPRIFQITKDTTFTAEFAYDRVGTCGKDLALTWSYDPTNKVLTIGNAGEFTENMQFGVEAPGEMEELVIGNNVTAIGENAFANISTLKKVTIGEAVKTIHNNAFYNCVNLETIFNYRPTPTNAYSTAFDGVDKFECKLYVLPSSIDMYKAAAVWRDFYYTYAIGAEEATLLTNDVKVEPQDNAATVTWPTSENAATYTIEITKDGEVFCTLIFNGNGQLTGIAFAPGKNGNRHAPAAKMTANGLQFTVTGLNSATHYALTLQAKDDQNAVLASYSSEFTTTGTATAVDNVPGDQVQCTKILHNGQLFILRGDKTYTLQGQEVK